TSKEVRLHKPITLIGRSAECNVVLKAADVSKHHCQILLDVGQVVVEDLGSANGTFVNGRTVRRAPLRDGDELRIADHPFQVRRGPCPPRPPSVAGPERTPLLNRRCTPVRQSPPPCEPGRIGPRSSPPLTGALPCPPPPPPSPEPSSRPGSRTSRCSSAAN